MLKYFYVYNDALMTKIDLPFVPLSIYTHCTCVLSPFLKSNLKKIESPYPLAEGHAEMFTIDKHALLNERMGRQYLLYSLRRIIRLSDQ